MITKKVFWDLCIYMIILGIIVGLIFPFYALMLGTPSSHVLKPFFILSSVAAGIFVGFFNYFLAKRIVGKRIKVLAMKMNRIKEIISERNESAANIDCEDASCRIVVDSDDELGEAASSFNALVASLSVSYKTENSLKVFNKTISSRLELNLMCDAALNQIVDHSQSAGGLIIIEQNGELEIISHRGIKENKELLKHEIIWRVLRKMEIESIRLPEDIKIDGILVSYQPKEILFVPIIYKELCLGIILLASTSYYNEQMKSDIQLLNSSFSLALKNALSYNQLQELAANDPLTNIFNRRFGLMRLSEEYARSLRNNSPIGVFIADIDFFKSVNDTYGHTVGDRVLIQITRTAKQALREGDIFIRYGGEEFMAILPGASYKDTQLVAEKFRRMVQESSVQHLDQEIKVTISIGITSFPENDASKMEEIIEKADQALYRAKDSGRNCVI
ncbi:MAG: GGDEF domain-containing protein [Acholeplasmataceae bacterium]|nr:GGDEF domain-containing protein [Acholeplasmataceae bacterium]